MQKSVTTGIILYLILVYLTYVLYAIGESDDNIRQAIQTRDISLLEDYVDFEALRDSLKRQIKTDLLFKATQSDEGDSNRSIALREISIANSLVEDFVDLYVSSTGIEKLFDLESNSGQSKNSGKAGNVVRQLKSDRFINLAEGRIKSLTTVQVLGFDQAGRAYEFIFTFRLIKWVLTDIRLDLKDINAGQVVDFIDQVNRSIN